MLKPNRTGKEENAGCILLYRVGGNYYKEFLWDIYLWLVCSGNNNVKGMGCSAKVEIPRYIADKITSFGELSSLVKNTYKSELVNRLDEIGTNGVITNLGYTRVDEFEDALNCAFGYISNSNNY